MLDKIATEIFFKNAKINLSIAEISSLNQLLPQCEDWDILTTHIIDRGLAPLLYKKLPLLSNSHLIPTQVQTKLRAAYYKTVSRSMMLYGAYHEVIEQFIKAGIPVIALKGMYISEHLYQDIGLRLMSDIDLLVREEDGERCLKLLESLGYSAMPFQKNISEFTDSVGVVSFQESGQAHYRPMLKGEVSVEIHTKLQNTSEQYQQSLTDIWQYAKSVTINGLPALALDNYNLLIHLCLHLHKHNTVLEHVQFTSFADIVNLLCKIDDGLPPSPLKGEQKRKSAKLQVSCNTETVDNSLEELPLGRGAMDFVWEEFIAKCNLYNAEEPVFKYLLLCREYFNAPLPDYIYEAYKHTFNDFDRDLFYKHLTGYNFAADRDNSAVPVHFRNIKHIKNPLLKLRYVWEVVFPGKEFMIEKYNKLMVNDK